MKAEFSAKRKLIVIQFLTLDGVSQAPGGEEEDHEGGFKHGGWMLPFFGDDDSVIQNVGNAGALLLGRKTYDIFAAYWPTVGRSVEWFGPFMNQIPKYVASKTLRKTEWENSTLLDGDVGDAVTRLKNEPGKDIYMFGSGNLIQSLMRHNLVDEYLLMFFPLVLGSGKRLFNEGVPRQDFEVVKSKTTKMGVFVANYKVKK